MESKNKEIFIKMLVVITFAAMVAINALANILPLNGISTAEVSNSYPNLFAPTGLTFAIWGVIYLLLSLHTLYQVGFFRGRKEQANYKLLHKTAIAFSVSSLINFVWIFSWHYKIIPLSMILMLSLLICLMYIANLINAQSLTLREKIFIRLPFSVYFGWITVATIANATTLLVSVGWNGFGLPESTWTVIILVIGLILGVYTAIHFKDIAFGIVIIWAYLGILIKHTAESGFSNQYQDVVVTLILYIILLVVTIIYIAAFGKHRNALN